MGIAKKYKCPFFENEYYHIYNRSNNKELLFLDDEDRNYFLSQFNYYCTSFVEMITWNLLDNHFHFYIQVKDVNTIITYLKSKPIKDLCATELKFLDQKISEHKLIDNAFKRLFISYSSYFNKTHHRKGNLFHRPFKHVKTENEMQYINTILYINLNAIRHKIVSKIEDHKWSSYHGIILENQANPQYIALLKKFGGKSNFIQMIHEQIDSYLLCGDIPDED
jgi:REP element-mobilizing transposase RayT